MGWERKRGKIEEFNRLLRGATDTSFSTQVGDARHAAVGPLLHHARLRHAPAARRREAADRHHRASAEPAAGSTRASAASPTGYGILQPRVSVTMASAAGSLFARTYAGHTGVDPYTTAVSDVYQDLFDEGHLHRQGPLRRRRVRGGARGPRARERAAVARSVRGPVRAHRARHRRRGRRRLPVERPRARAAPAPLGARRLADPVVAVSVRAVARRPAAQSAAADRALEDSRQPAAQPGRRRRRCCCSCSAGRRCRAARSSWTAMALAPLALPVLVPAAELLGGPRRGTAVARVSCRSTDRGSRDRCRARGPAAHVPGERGLRADCTRSASRSCVWESPAAGCSSGRRRRRAPRAAAAVTHRAFLSGMRASPLLALATLAARRRRRGRGALPAAAPLLALWAAAPLDRVRAQPPDRRRAARRCRPPTASICTRSPGRRGRTSTRSSTPRITPCRPTTCSSRPNADRRAPDVADQHRPGRCWRRSPRTTSASSTPRSCSDRIDATLTTVEAAGTVRGPSAELVRHADAGAACRRPTSRRSTAATSRARC